MQYNNKHETKYMCILSLLTHQGIDSFLQFSSSILKEKNGATNRISSFLLVQLWSTLGWFHVLEVIGLDPLDKSFLSILKSYNKEKKWNIQSDMTVFSNWRTNVKDNASFCQIKWIQSPSFHTHHKKLIRPKTLLWGLLHFYFIFTVYQLT